MLKYREEYSEVDFSPIIVVEVPVVKEFLQDCYSYNAMDAPSELKSMLLEQLAETIDRIVLEYGVNEGNPTDVINSTKKKLDIIKIVYDNEK